jgi:LmbE family N-acetylglucosaminyl deacetylase
MLELNLAKRGPLKVLCLGAHSDDIEIGCGGLILSLIKGQRSIDVTWVVFSASHERQREARRGAAAFLKGAKRTNVIVKQFKDGHFPYEGPAVKSVFESLKSINPDLVLTHYRDDRHQDHRVLSDLAWNTFRDHFVLEYEIPKFDGDLGQPNLFVPFDGATATRKADYLTKVFGTQRDKHWFSAETFKGLMRLRGMECRAPGGYAEAFYARKSVVSF